MASQIQQAQFILDAKYRAEQIEMNRRNKIISDYNFQQSQAKLYADAVPYFTPMSYNDMLQSNSQERNRSIVIERGICLQNLAKLSPSMDEALSILAQLDDDQVLYLNDSYSNFVSELRKTFRSGNIKHVVFLDFVRKYLSNHRVEVQNVGSSSSSVPSTIYPGSGSATPIVVGTPTFGSSSTVFTPIPSSTPKATTPVSSTPKATTPVSSTPIPSSTPGFSSPTPSSISIPSTPVRPTKKDLAAEILTMYAADPSMESYIRANLPLKTANIDLAHVSGKNRTQVETVMMDLRSGAWKKSSSSSSSSSSAPVSSGTGFTKLPRRVIHGRGAHDLSIKDKRYYVDMKSLNNGILSVRYTSCANFKIKPIAITPSVKGVVLDIIHDKFEPRLYEILNKNEKVIIQNFVREMGLDNIDIKETELDDIFNDWQILQSQILAGNDSKPLVAQLKSLTIQLMRMKRIPHSQGNQLLVSL